MDSQRSTLEWGGDTESGTGNDDGASVHASDLTLFQLNILAHLHGETKYGLGIKADLREYYGKDINHGRLYPNLDELVDLGLVEKTERDKRTNDYDLTVEGMALINERTDWLLAQLDQTIGDPR